MRACGVDVARCTGVDNRAKPSERGAGGRFDRDMDQHEPVLILTIQEILNHEDIVEVDRIVLVDQSPIIEDIAGIGH